MGNWAINIIGMGQHHNRRNVVTGEFDPTGKFDDKDANQLFQEFVQKLVDAGHNIDSATFTHGARDAVDVTFRPYGNHAGEQVTTIDNRPDWKREQDSQPKAVAE